jgi:hypothetical protein
MNKLPLDKFTLLIKNFVSLEVSGTDFDTTKENDVPDGWINTDYDALHQSMTLAEVLESFYVKPSKAQIEQLTIKFQDNNDDEMVEALRDLHHTLYAPKKKQKAKPVAVVEDTEETQETTESVAEDNQDIENDEVVLTDDMNQDSDEESDVEPEQQDEESDVEPEQEDEGEFANSNGFTTTVPEIVADPNFINIIGGDVLEDELDNKDIIMLYKPSRCLQCVHLVGEVTFENGTKSVPYTECYPPMMEEKVNHSCPAMTMNLVKGVNIEKAAQALAKAEQNRDSKKLAKIYSTLSKYHPSIDEAIQREKLNYK